MRATSAGAPLLLAVILAATGCSATDSDAAQECAAAVRALADAPEDATNEIFDPLLRASLDACTAEDWLIAIAEQPVQMVREDGEPATPELLGRTCVRFPDTAACAR